MDRETAQTTTTAKFPILKQEKGNPFILVAQTITNVDGTSTTLIPGPVTTKEKVQKKNDVKARSMLLMTISNEHLMTFDQYKDAKTLFAAIQTRFGGNVAIKKTQKTLLKQMYENFNAPSTESLDSIFNRLQKIVSQLGILGENISQEDLNLKFLRSLPSEWNTHVVVWRNKLDLDTMSFDDLYNNFKIVEQEECRQPKNQDSRNRNQDSSRRFVNVEETASNAMVAIDGAGFDWSYMKDDEVPTNMALMVFSTCLKTYLKSFETLKTLKTQLDDLRIEFNKYEFNLATYKKGLASVEEKLVVYKKNETIKSVSEDIPNKVKESPDAILVKELVSNDKLEKKTVFPTVTKIEFIKPKQQEKLVRKPVNNLMVDMLPFGEEPKEGKLLVKELLKLIASIPMETSKPLLKDENAKDVDVHLYRSMIGSLMYLTSSRPDIMFVVCACARFQVIPNFSHLYAVKRIFRYLKVKEKQEKDIIETKPDKNGKCGEARQCRRPVTVEKARKMKKTQSLRAKYANPTKLYLLKKKARTEFAIYSKKKEKGSNCQVGKVIKGKDDACNS
nr:hypothetical protein [Tanacetum cinerariifolium]